MTQQTYWVTRSFEAIPHGDTILIKPGSARGKTKRPRAIITRTARTRVYAYLADQLGIARDACHVGLFDLQTCRRAWKILSGVNYSDIRRWAKHGDA